MAYPYPTYPYAYCHTAMHKSVGLEQHLHTVCGTLMHFVTQEDTKLCTEVLTGVLSTGQNYF